MTYNTQDRNYTYDGNKRVLTVKASSKKGKAIDLAALSLLTVLIWAQRKKKPAKHDQ